MKNVIDYDVLHRMTGGSLNLGRWRQYLDGEEVLLEVRVAVGVAVGDVHGVLVMGEGDVEGECVGGRVIFTFLVTVEARVVPAEKKKGQ